MQAKLLSLRGVWFVSILPTSSCQLNLFEVEREQNPFVNQILPIDRLDFIDIKNWKGGEIFNGNVVTIKDNSFFRIRNEEVKYLNQNTISFDETKTYILLMGWLCNNKHIAITPDQYNYLLNIAKTENVISSYFNNGFCINYKYVVYGRLTKDKQIIYPQIKIK